MQGNPSVQKPGPTVQRRANADVVRPAPRKDAQTPAAPPKQRPRLRFFRRWPLVLAVIGVIIFGFLTYGYISTKRQLASLAGPSAAQNGTNQLVQKIGAHVALPNETPTIATVEDVTKLNRQDFFKNAQNGDKVLVYAQSGRALLYRPSTEKVIEYSRVSLNAATP